MTLLRAKALEYFYHSELYSEIYPHREVRYSADEANSLCLQLLISIDEEDEPSEEVLIELMALCCYLVSGADGKITPAEKRKVKGFYSRGIVLEYWKVFDTQENEELLQRYAELVEWAVQTQTRRRLSSLISRLIDLARADRNLSDQEIEMIGAIAEGLGVEDLAGRRLKTVLGYDPFKGA